MLSGTHSDAAKDRMTTANGTPVADNQNSVSAGSYGPLLLQDTQLLEKLAHFDRERIPERVVHAKGAGAHGYFEVTHDVTDVCRAKFLAEVGSRTPVIARFSTVGGEKGSADTARDPRGFAVKFYTEEGNWDMVGNNTPVFFIRDPSKFPDFIHTQKRDPRTNLPDVNMFWDFLSLVPESCHQVTILFSDRGTPDGYRHMNGYGSHTFRCVNQQGVAHWVKFHFKTDQGIRNLDAATAVRLAGEDPDHATRDLFEAIQRGDYPSWTMHMQVMPEADAWNYRFNSFDVTKVWPHKDYPLRPVGKLVLNRNPENYFAEIEQAAFSPSHMVPGIEPSPDKMLQGRLFSYPDTHRHRLGPNYQQIPVNCPYRTRAAHHQRDGMMTVNGNFGSQLNYEPNSAQSAAPDTNAPVDVLPYKLDGRFQEKGGAVVVTRHTPRWHQQDDYVQAGDLYRLLSSKERDALVGNIVRFLGGARHDIQQRMVQIFKRCDPEYGARVEQGLAKA